MITNTNTLLLMGLRNQGDDRIWTEFCDRYRPLVIAFGQRMGLVVQDAQDAAQETLLAFATAYREGKYDREKGRLRTWLSAIAVNKVRDIQRRRARDVAAGDGRGKGFMERIADDRTVSEAWESEWHRATVNACMEEVRDHVEPVTLQAFELFVLKERPADEVAAHLGISRNAVFLAKRRVLSRLREARERLEETW